MFKENEIKHEFNDVGLQNVFNYIDFFKLTIN